MTERSVIYLDNAATSPIREEVLNAMTQAMRSDYFNPSALYAPSAEISAEIRRIRSEICAALHAPEGEMYFTSGGTESNNTALFCTRKPKGSRIIVGMGEHDSVYAPANELKAQGYDVRFVPITRDGTIDAREFENLLDESVSLISVMHASNETGGINDIAALVKLAKKRAPKCVFHSDGVQAAGKIPVNLRALGVDMYSVSAHKIHGPKGIGALFIKKGVSAKPLLFGGGQEKGMRSGTENFPSIAALREAIRIYIENEYATNYSKISKYRELFKARLTEIVSDIEIITPTHNSVPNILTVAFKDVRGEVLLHSLENYGIYVGIGSACSSHHESRFKSLLGLDDRHRDGVVRFSFSEENDLSEIDFVVDCIKRELEILTKYRRI